jgi:uncharacterized membrane protein YdfJ with MMPL/SSD domain
MKQRMPIVFAFVLGLAFVLMLLAFRSVVIPIKTVLLNLLSVLASYGHPRCRVSSTTGAGASSAHAPTAPSHLGCRLPLRDPLRALDGLPRFILSRVKERVDAA